MQQLCKNVFTCYHWYITDGFDPFGCVVVQESLMQGDDGVVERRAQLKQAYDTTEQALRIINEASFS